MAERRSGAQSAFTTTTFFLQSKRGPRKFLMRVAETSLDFDACGYARNMPLN